MATVGERIKKLRIAQGFTQARLAEILLSVSSMNRKL